METTMSLPWEDDGDPPDEALMLQALHVAVLLQIILGRYNGGRWGGGVVSSTTQCGCAGMILRRYGCEIPGTREEQLPGDDAHEVTTTEGFEMEGDPACSHEQNIILLLQLDLGLTDITKFFSYSKLWRMLYFVNDAPFRIRNHGDRLVDSLNGLITH